MKEAFLNDPKSENLSQLPSTRLSVLMILVVSVMVADLFLGDLDIGPASSRIYLLAVALVLTALQVLRGELRLFSSRSTMAIALSYGLFILWASVNSFIRGQSVADIVLGFGPTILFGWLLFVFAQAAIRRPSDVTLLEVSLLPPQF